MKNCGYGAVVIASGETSSAKVPQKPEFKQSKKFLFFAASALIICVSLGFTQSTKAEETFTVARIQLALGGEQAANSQRSAQSSDQYDGDLSARTTLRSRLQPAIPARLAPRRLIRTAGSTIKPMPRCRNSRSGLAQFSRNPPRPCRNWQPKMPRVR